MAATKNNHESKVQEFYNEKVPVFIRRPEGVKDNSCTITLNGKNFQILYNTEVMVPRCIALIVEESERNERIAEENVQRLMGGDKRLGEV
ncbi:MAG: hypothetical protein HFE49_07330 [Clostridia bacterium]|nr:hypothetical protein [Clostridia bacterium]